MWQFQGPLYSDTFAALLAYLKVTLDAEDLYCWYRWKKRYLSAIAAAKTSENHGDEWSFIRYLWWDIYINSNLDPLTQFNSSIRSTKFKDMFQWNIIQMIVKTIHISTRIVISCSVKRGIPFWVWSKASGKCDNMITIFQGRESHYRGWKK